MKPKKPLSPYFRFLVDVRPKVTAENPKLTLTEIAQEIGKRWRSADEQMKKKYAADFAKEKEAYEKVKARYDMSLTPSQKEEIVDAKRHAAELKEKSAHRKKNRDNNKPKKPASGFIRFSVEVFANEKRGETDVNDFRRVIAQRWAALPDEKKKPYLDAFQQELVKYKKDLSSWEAKMIRLGNVDLVRAESITPVHVELKQRERRPKATKSD